MTKRLAALNLVAEGLSNFLTLKRCHSAEEVHGALDLMNKSNPELIIWMRDLMTRAQPTTPSHERISTAQWIACMAHRGQVSKYQPEEPYLNHVARVVALVQTDDQKAVAWLHDVLEDNPHWTPARLAENGIPEHIIKSVLILTRVKSRSYEAYIGYVKDRKDADAITVKLADLKDHLRPGCPVHLRPRYEAAYLALGGIIAENTTPVGYGCGLVEDVHRG